MNTDSKTNNQTLYEQTQPIEDLEAVETMWFAQMQNIRGGVEKAKDQVQVQVQYPLGSVEVQRHF